MSIFSLVDDAQDGDLALWKRLSLYDEMSSEFLLAIQICWKLVEAPKTEVWMLFPNFFTANILFWEHLEVIYMF